MSDLSFREAEQAAVRRQAEELGADYGIDAESRLALTDQLVFLRNNPAHVDDPIVFDSGNELTYIIGWACEDEAAILLGRLAERGWRLVHT